MEGFFSCVTQEFHVPLSEYRSFRKEGEIPEEEQAKRDQNLLNDYARLTERQEANKHIGMTHEAKGSPEPEEETISERDCSEFINGLSPECLEEIKNILIHEGKHQSFTNRGFERTFGREALEKARPALAIHNLVEDSAKFLWGATAGALTNNASVFDEKNTWDNFSTGFKSLLECPKIFGVIFKVFRDRLGASEQTAVVLESLGPSGLRILEMMSKAIKLAKKTEKIMSLKKAAQQFSIEFPVITGIGAAQKIANYGQFVDAVNTEGNECKP